MNTNKTDYLLIIACVWLSLVSCNKIDLNKRYEMDLSKLEWKLWLDSTAQWENDSLYLPPVDISGLQTNPPTGGWENIDKHQAKIVHLPAVVEEYFWFRKDSSFKTVHGTEGDYKGVSWFVTSFKLPSALKGKRFILSFESVRIRAEIYVNKKLSGYDCIGNTPFDADITDAVEYGKKNTIAIRITDPDGNFSWEDYDVNHWGHYKIPSSHGFGGITGKVKLIATDKTYIEDIFVKNKPMECIIDVDVSLSNPMEKAKSGSLTYSIYGFEEGLVIRSKTVNILNIKKNAVLTEIFKVPEAMIWTPDKPNLYEIRVEWKGDDGSHDNMTKRFGFRWFDIRNINGDKQFFLNEKRVFLLSAISWGFWPKNGIYPSEELAERQIYAAKNFGLNMLNFHRCIGQSIVLDKADEKGLMYYEEPGGYISINGDSFTNEIRHEKLARMIKRDRNHPSLIIYSMQNEACRDPQDDNRNDMMDMHTIDPTRFITFSSQSYDARFYKEKTYGGFCPKDPAPSKMFMKPYCDTLQYQGWWDEHHAAGPGCYADDQYMNPKNYYLYTNHKEEAIFLGEEGSVGSVSRLQLIKDELEDEPKGLDGDHFISLYNSYEKFLKDKQFDKVFKDVDDFCLQMGNVCYYYQGRAIENARINNIIDGYVINGWESEKMQNYSGIVDCYRYPKGNVNLIAKYNQKLYVSVKIRNKVIAAGSSTKVDFYIVNMLNYKGSFDLSVKASDKEGVFFEKTIPVNISGGTTFGELIAEGVEIKTRDKTESGYIEVNAVLKRQNHPIAKGEDQIYTVALDKTNLPDAVSVIDTSNTLQSYLKQEGIKTDNYKNGRPSTKILITGRTNPTKVDQSLLDWIKEGNVLILAFDADHWAKCLADMKAIDYSGRLDLGSAWDGGNYFVKDHELFNGLPVNQVLNWEYQVLVRTLSVRFGLKLKNEEAIVGAVSQEIPEGLTAVGIVNYGKGKIILSTLWILPNLTTKERANVVSQQLFLNYLRYANKNSISVH